MGLPQLNTFCCGCTLKTGAIIVGVVDAIWVIIMLIVSILVSVVLNDPSIDTTTETGDEQTLYSMFVAYSVFSAIYLIMAIMLIVGASKNSPNCLIPWLGYVFAYIIVYLVGAIINSISYFSLGNVGAACSFIISGILGISLQFYFFLVVYSLYRLLKNPLKCRPTTSNIATDAEIPLTPSNAQSIVDNL
ncbi:uncharacterized protein LOC143921296 [Arctopsyche grandis]|uniref:uncharacterized protein LOC143921296 n=1 Tax=Arctopsyche grandis TaxID=121162 RepID=UPI00406D634D